MTLSTEPETGWLTTAEAAAAWGVTPATWRKYVSAGHAPKADDPGTGPVNRRTPRWRAETVEAAKAARRGQAWRRASGA